MAGEKRVAAEDARKPSIARAVVVEAVADWLRGLIEHRRQANSYGSISVTVTLKEGRAVEIAFNDGTTVRIRD